MVVNFTGVAVDAVLVDAMIPVEIGTVVSCDIVLSLSCIFDTATVDVDVAAVVGMVVDKVGFKVEADTLSVLSIEEVPVLTLRVAFESRLLKRDVATASELEAIVVQPSEGNPADTGFEGEAGTEAEAAFA